MKHKKSIIVAFVALLLVVGTVSAISLTVDEAREIFGEPRQEQLGSVTVGNEYNATTTAPSTAGFLQNANPFLIKTGQGALGSVVVTHAGAGAGGVVNFYNATTTNVLLRTGQVATSTIILTSLPTDLAAGTYVFDVTFTSGLIMDSIGGTVGTSTITFR